MYFRALRIHLFKNVPKYNAVKIIQHYYYYYGCAKILV